MNKRAVSHILTEVLNIAWSVLVLKRIGKYAVLELSERNSRHMLRILRCTWSSIISQQMLRLCYEQVSRVSYSNRSTQSRLGCLSAKCDWQMCCVGAVIMWLKTYAEDCPVHLNFDHMPANGTPLLRICKSVTPILTQLFNITSLGLYTELDLWSWGSCRITRIRRHTWQRFNYAFSLFWLQNATVASGSWCTTNLQLTHDSKHFCCNILIIQLMLFIVK